MVMPGAFAATLTQRGVRRMPMLFQHDPAEPIGVWLESREDYRGLYARGRLIPEVARARELLALLRAGAVDGLSIGFRTVKGRLDPKTRIRRLDRIDLWEISIVTFPLLPGARVRAVKEAPAPLPAAPSRADAQPSGSGARGDAAVETPRCPRRRRAASRIAPRTVQPDGKAGSPERIRGWIAERSAQHGRPQARVRAAGAVTPACTARARLSTHKENDMDIDTHDHPETKAGIAADARGDA